VGLEHIQSILSRLSVSSPPRLLAEKEQLEKHVGEHDGVVAGIKAEMDELRKVRPLESNCDAGVTGPRG
jgi:hypothetical protein